MRDKEDFSGLLLFSPLVGRACHCIKYLENVIENEKSKVGRRDEFFFCFTYEGMDPKIPEFTFLILVLCLMSKICYKINRDDMK